MYAVRPMAGEQSIEPRHLWLPPNVACEILHAIPYGRYRNCSRVAQLQSLALSAFRTAGSQGRSGPSMCDSAMSARTAFSMMASMHFLDQAPLRPRGC